MDTVRTVGCDKPTIDDNGGTYRDFVHIWGSHQLSAGMPSLPNLVVHRHVNFFVL